MHKSSRKQTEAGTWAHHTVEPLCEVHGRRRHPVNSRKHHTHHGRMAAFPQHAIARQEDLTSPLFARCISGASLGVSWGPSQGRGGAHLGLLACPDEALNGEFQHGDRVRNLEVGEHLGVDHSQRAPKFHQILTNFDKFHRRTGRSESTIYRYPYSYIFPLIK